MPVAVYLGCSENVLARQDLPSGATDDSYARSETGEKTIRWGPADWPRSVVDWLAGCAGWRAAWLTEITG